jgi:hypothetical protein
MSRSPLVPKHWPGLGLLVLALAAFALVFATTSAGAADPGQRLVLRGQATAVAGPCSAVACPLELDRGRYRGSLGRGAYSGSLKLTIANSFPNGEGGSCAPLTGRIELRMRSADHIGLIVSGDSCQDGSGPLDGASFTGLARFRVTHGTGAYAGATGSGLVTFAEDAAKHHRMTLVGRVRKAS